MSNSRHGTTVDAFVIVVHRGVRPPPQDLWLTETVSWCLSPFIRECVRTVALHRRIHWTSYVLDGPHTLPPLVSFCLDLTPTSRTSQPKSGRITPCRR
jgi:hypothetical protein